MRVVVMGCGRVGAALAAELSREGNDVVVLDNDPSAFRFLPDNFRGVTFVGSGIDLDVLEKIHVGDATIRSFSRHKAFRLSQITRENGRSQTLRYIVV